MAGRVRHPIDVKSLEAYLKKNVPEIKTPLDVKQFGFGQSNPTYQLTSADGTRYVLRKKPPGQLLSKTAHKVDREHRILTALGPTPVPVPRTFCLCEDPAVLGTAFYVMEFLDGRIIEDPAMPDLPAGAAGERERRALWQAAVETLARLHSVDRDAVGLASFGKPSGFYARQLATWRQICAAQAAAVDADTGVPVGPLPHIEEFLRFFAGEPTDGGKEEEEGSAAPPSQQQRWRRRKGPVAVKPPRDRATLIHGDYKIDNIVFHKTEPRVIGILDWEMSTVGHPLSDLANLLNPYYTVGIYGTGGSEAFRPGRTPGLPTPTEVLGWYAGAAGWDPTPEMGWAAAFSVFRVSAICQGIAARVATRQASSENAKKHSEALAPLAELAWAMVEKEKTKAEEQQGSGSVPAKL
ncbi:phosphotransferase enzyme family domain-containing protein [Xylariales sp. PMI_506]|nr:phosphotransferase enzyme family domain-containing protein [Xylariales sp. PMI_506]